MTHTLRGTMRYSLLLVCFWLSSLTPVRAQNLADVAAKTGKLNTMLKLAKQAGLEASLKGTNPYTVFAPTDTAFGRLPKGALAKLSKNPELLRHALTYHAAAGNLSTKQWKEGALPTLAGYDAALNRKNGSWRINDAKIVKADLKASNGTIHLIDKVLLSRKLLDALAASGKEKGK